MDQLREFVADLYAAVPTLPKAMLAAGENAEPDMEIPTAWLGDLGHELALVLASLDPGAAQRAFSVIERYLVEGGEVLSTGIATGLLEALAGRVDAGQLSGPLLATYLGPESRAYIDAWDQFTLGHSSLT